MAESRISLVVDLESRAGALTKDGLLTNGFVELQPTPMTFMRPGLSTYVAAANTNGQGVIAKGTTRLLRISGGILDIAV